MSREVNFFLTLRSSTQTVSSARTTAHYLPKTSIVNMDEHPQNRSNSYRCYTCSHVLIVLSIFMIFGGTITLGMGALAGSLSDHFYKSFPEVKIQSRIELNAGIGVVVTGVVVLILSCTWCCYVRHKRTGSWHPSRATTDATNYNANASNTAFTLEVQPSISHGPGRLPTYEYSYRQQAGSIQQVQTGAYQYTSAHRQAAFILSTPEQTAVNHFPVAQLALNQLPPAQLSLNQLLPAQTAINRYPSAHDDKPPPSYNEVMGDLR